MAFPNHTLDIERPDVHSFVGTIDNAESLIDGVLPAASHTKAIIPRADSADLDFQDAAGFSAFNGNRPNQGMAPVMLPARFKFAPRLSGAGMPFHSPPCVKGAIAYRIPGGDGQNGCMFARNSATEVC